MKVARVVAREIVVPLKMSFRTSAVERERSDNVVVEVVLEDGTSGFGEGVPREYVTGETPASCFEFVKREGAALIGFQCDSFHEAVERAADLGFGDDPRHPRCAARAALEVALLDAAGRAFGVSLSQLVEHLPDLASIARARNVVRYGVVVSAGAGWRSALKYRLYGFRDAKLKVGLDRGRDAGFVKSMRRRLGPAIDVRVDVNGAWPADEAAGLIREMGSLGVSFVEQPVAPADSMSLADIRRDAKVPVMLDESLVSERDAQLAVDGKWCDAFNIRISKNGGLIPAMRLAKLAADSSLGWQLGCHPGETGVLSAAGRAFAASVRDILYLEGSYDSHLLERNVIAENITFGFGGKAPRLTGPGLGVTVKRDVLDAITKQTVAVEGPS